jgi:hypothetical protein
MSENLRRSEGEYSPAAFIARAGWQDARRPFREAHQYTLRGRVSAGVPPPPPEWHDAFIRHIEEHGYREKFEGRWYAYLRVGEFVYWPSRAVFPPFDQRIVNRRRADAADA